MTRYYESRESVRAIFYYQARWFWNRFAAEPSNSRSPWRLVGPNESAQQKRRGSFAAPAALNRHPERSEGPLAGCCLTQGAQRNEWHDCVTETTTVTSLVVFATRDDNPSCPRVRPEIDTTQSHKRTKPRLSQFAQ